MKYELINFCEIDKFAIDSYCRIHNESSSENLGDISKVNTTDIQDFDLLVGGSPCQDFSLAGKKGGATYTCTDCGYKYNPLEAHYTKRNCCPKCGSQNLEKTRSSLIVEYLRILREKQPKFAIYENVKNIIGKEFKPIFDLFLKEVNEIGYVPYYQVLNAKDYGIPQNRERVIAVFIRKDIDHGFSYPEKLNIITTINDIVQKDVPTKYYIDNKKSDPLVQELILRGKLSENYQYLYKKRNQINCLGLLNMKGMEQIRRVYDKFGCAPTLCTRCDGIKVLEHCHYLFNINPSGKGISGSVYGVDSVSPMISSESHKGINILFPMNQNKVVAEYRTDLHYISCNGNVCGTLRTIDSCGCKRIIEPIDLPICVASRGRYVDNPSVRIAGLPTKQRLEPNEFNIFNTLTSVQKDNYILENKTNLYKNNFYITDYPIAFEFEDRIPLNTQENNTNILTILKTYFYKYHKLPSMYNLQTNKEFIYGENDKNLLCLTTHQIHVFISIFNETGYRVRKLTPRESFRLMGFKDEFYEKARYYTNEEQLILDKLEKKYQTEYDQHGKNRGIKLSDAQAYKQAGNSIVVNVLYYLFQSLKEQYPEFTDGMKVCSLFSGIGAFEQALAAVGNQDILLLI